VARERRKRDESSEFATTLDTIGTVCGDCAILLQAPTLGTLGSPHLPHQK